MQKRQQGYACRQTVGKAPERGGGDSMTEAELNRFVCEVFLEFPAAPAEPWEGSQTLRDGHFYAQMYLDGWQQRLRRDWGIGFIPLPWYRQKAVCQQAARRVRGELSELWSERPQAYTREHVGQVWNCMRKAIAVEAPKEYNGFYALVLERSDC